MHVHTHIAWSINPFPNLDDFFPCLFSLNVGMCKCASGGQKTTCETSSLLHHVGSREQTQVLRPGHLTCWGSPAGAPYLLRFPCLPRTFLFPALSKCSVRTNVEGLTGARQAFHLWATPPALYPSFITSPFPLGIVVLMISTSRITMLRTLTS